MKTQTKIYIGLVVAAIFVGLLGGAAWSNHKVGKLEQAVDTAKQKADEISNMSATKEAEAAEYKQRSNISNSN